jgi:hypothetical protein
MICSAGCVLLGSRCDALLMLPVRCHLSKPNDLCAVAWHVLPAPAAAYISSATLTDCCDAVTTYSFLLWASCVRHGSIQQYVVACLAH